MKKFIRICNVCIDHGNLDYKSVNQLFYFLQFRNDKNKYYDINYDKIKR